MTADLGPNQLVNNCRLARIWCAQNADLKEALHCIGSILCTHVAWFVMAVSLSCAVFSPQAFASTIANSRRVLIYQMCRFQALTWKKFSEDILSCSLRYFDAGCLCQRIMLYWRKGQELAVSNRTLCKKNSGTMKSKTTSIQLIHTADLKQDLHSPVSTGSVSLFLNCCPENADTFRSPKP